MYVVSISVEKRAKTVPDIQSTLTKYGDSITTRLGIHDPGEKSKGIMIVTYVGENIEEFVEELNSLDELLNVNFMEV